MYKRQAYGVPCTRILGNSAFQVNQADYYKVKYTQNAIVIPRYDPGTNDNQDPE